MNEGFAGRPRNVGTFNHVLFQFYGRRTLKRPGWMVDLCECEATCNLRIESEACRQEDLLPGGLNRTVPEHYNTGSPRTKVALTSVFNFAIVPAYAHFRPAVGQSIRHSRADNA